MLAYAVFEKHIFDKSVPWLFFTFLSAMAVTCVGQFFASAKKWHKDGEARRSISN